MKRSNLVKMAVATLTATTLATTAIPASAKTTPLAIAAGPAAQVGEVTVTTETLNVRSGPSTGDGVIGKLTCGQKVQPTGKTTDGAWWRIDLNGASGFIFAQYATEGGTCGSPAAAAPAPAAAAPAPAAEAGGSVFTVSSATLNVRSGPGYSYSILGRLNQGQTINATGKTADGAWLQFDYNGTKAYVFAQYTTAGGTAPAAGAAPAAPAAGASGGFELGAHIKGTDYLGQMKDIGMNWVKYQVVFDGGTPDVSGIIGAVHGAGMKILIGAVGNRSRASDTGYHKEFAAGLAGIATQGADAIEVWNEPNLDREYGSGGAGQVNPENYVNMLKEAYTAIKAANGGTMVISGAPAPTGYYGGNCTSGGCDDAPFLQRVAAAGGANYADCIGAHHNGSMVGPDQTSGAPVGSADHSQWYFQGTLAVAYNAFGGKRPVCWTELGYVTGEGIGPLPGGFAWGSSITLGNQAEWLARAAQLSRDSGKVRLMIVWNADFRQFNDDPQSGFSIFRPDGSCPACATIRTVMGK